MHVVQALLSLANVMPLELPVMYLSKCYLTGINYGWTYALSPLLGSNGWSTVEECANQRVNIFGNVWNTYLFPCANERR